jgi:hypothetical protein
MRRSASEVIRNLEMRIARLERQSAHTNKVRISKGAQKFLAKHSKAQITENFVRQYGMSVLSVEVNDVVETQAVRGEYGNPDVVEAVFTGTFTYTSGHRPFTEDFEGVIEIEMELLFSDSSRDVSRGILDTDPDYIEVEV